MSSSFIEDLFILFFDTAQVSRIPLQPQDRKAAYSFYNQFVTGQQITQAQANYVLKILDKYKKYALNPYDDLLINPVWKQPFRVIDKSKKVWVEEREKHPLIGLKFPYELKQEYDEEFDSYRGESFWDKENRIRYISFYDYNPIQVNEFVRKHGFEIDQSFEEAIAQIEHIWQNQEYILPGYDGEQLINAVESAQEFFDNNKTENYSSNLLLAKQIGHPFINSPNTICEQIASNKESKFWIGDPVKFFNLTENIDGKVAIVIDRNANDLEWIKKFLEDADANEIDRDNIRVCYRSSSEYKKEFNKYIKEQNVTGKLEGRKYLIFYQKIPKWLLKDIDDVKILVTNYLFRTSNRLTRLLMETHPCVIYYTDVLPTTVAGETDIVHL